MNRILSAALLCGLVPSAAFAQAAADISNQVGTLISPNTRGAITASGLRTVLNALNQEKANVTNPTFTGTSSFVGPFSVAATAGYWTSNTTPANFVRLNDRLVIGKDAQSWSGAYTTSGTDFAWTMGQGIYGYLPRNALTWTANPYGTIGGLFSSRTGDSSKLPGISNSGCCAIPVASLALNDNSTTPQAAWNYYATAVKTAGAGDTHNAEFDVLNATNTVTRIGPYTQDSGGITLGLSLNAGGEGAPYNNPSNPPYPNVAASSAAMQIFGNGTTFDKGIVVKSAAISPTADGQTVAIELPTNNVIRWVYNGSPPGLGAFLNSSVSSSAASNGLNFTDDGAMFQSGLGTLYAQITTAQNAVNRPVLSPATAGNPVLYSALGSDTNIDIGLVPKGGGLVNLTAGFLMPFAAPASSSAACRPGQEQTDGAYLYVCVATNKWRRTTLSDF